MGGLGVEGPFEPVDDLAAAAGFDELPRKVQVVKEACEKIGRDPATLETSHLAIAIIDENVTADVIPDDFKQQAVYGSPEQVADGFAGEHAAPDRQSLLAASLLQSLASRS